MSYFSIHNHSEFSSIKLLDSINKVPALINRAIELKLSGIAITDHEVLSGHVQAIQHYKSLPEEIKKNFTLALGDEIYLVESLEGEKPYGYTHFILVAKNAIGHRALREISSTAWDNSYTENGVLRTPITKEQLKNIVNKFPNSLIASSACLGSELSKLVLQLIKEEEQQLNPNYTKQKIVDFITYCKDLFHDDFYIEVQPGIYTEQKLYNKRVKDISKALGVKIIYSTDSHYLKKEDRNIHKAFLNSKEGEREVDDFYATSYMMSKEEVWEYLQTDFTLEEFEELTHNSNEIKAKIQQYDLFKPQIIPSVEIDVEKVSHYFSKYKGLGYEYIDKMINSTYEQDQYWIGRVLQGYENKTLSNPVLNQQVYLERINTEAYELWEISNKLNNRMTKYYNTMSFLIQLMWDAGAMVGVARGSATGFLTNYYLDIIQLDPIAWNLSHWRHLSAERPELASVYWSV